MKSICCAARAGGGWRPNWAPRISVQSKWEALERVQLSLIGGHGSERLQARSCLKNEEFHFTIYSSFQCFDAGRDDSAGLAEAGGAVSQFALPVLQYIPQRREPSYRRHPRPCGAADAVGVRRAIEDDLKGWAPIELERAVQGRRACRYRAVLRQLILHQRWSAGAMRTIGSRYVPPRASNAASSPVFPSFRLKPTGASPGTMTGDGDGTTVENIGHRRIAPGTRRFAA